MDPDDDQINQNVLQHDTVAAIPVRDTVLVLRPEPNAGVDLQIMNEMNQKLTVNTNMKIDSVTGFVFKANPNNIEKHYGNQKAQYSKILFEKNTTSFKIKNNDTLYIGNLQYVPMLK